MPGRPVTRREFALKRCKLRGGHLVNIETEAENDFLSNVFSGNSSQGICEAAVVKGINLCLVNRGSQVLFPVSP